MAVTKRIVKLLVLLGGAALGTASLLVVSNKSGITDYLATLRDAADGDNMVVYYGVIPPPWEEEEKRDAADDATEPLLPSEPSLGDLEMLRDAADEQDAADNEPVAEEEQKRVQEKKREKRVEERWKGEKEGKPPPRPIYGPPPRERMN